MTFRTTYSCYYNVEFNTEFVIEKAPRTKKIVLVPVRIFKEDRESPQLHTCKHSEIYKNLEILPFLHLICNKEWDIENTKAYYERTHLYFITFSTENYIQ